MRKNKSIITVSGNKRDGIILSVEDKSSVQDMALLIEELPRVIEVLQAKLIEEEKKEL